MDNRAEKTKNAGIYGIIGNIFLLIIKEMNLLEKMFVFLVTDYLLVPLR